MQPTGGVSFFNGATLLATVPVLNGLALFDDTLTAPGTETLLARYSGDGNFAGSHSGTVPLTVIAQASSATILSASSKSVASGTIVTLTASVVSSGKPVTQGMVTFCNSNYELCEDAGVLGTAHLTSSGAASIKLAFPAGVNSVLALFSGTAQVIASKSNGQQITVAGTLASTTALAVSGKPGSYAFTTNVTGSWPPPFGQVSYTDISNNNLLLGTSFLGAGTPSFAPSSASAVGRGAYSEAVGDFNNDGKPDVAVANLLSNSVTILMGNGNGSLAANGLRSAARPISTSPSLLPPVTSTATARWM